MKKFLTITVFSALTFTAWADDHKKSTADLVKMALESDIRTEAEIERDGNRKPLQTLEFFGLQPDMKVVELMPGGGWYTKVLAPVLKEEGEMFVAYGTSRTSTLIEEHDELSHVKIAAKDANMYRKDGDRYYTLENPEIGVKNADMVLTFRNYHNFMEEGRKAMNEAVWDALKMGGIYAVVDHTRRHMEKYNGENGRRVDPVLAIKEIQAAGFELVDYSDLHFRADDELEYEVGRRSVTGNTDRFTLKFKKVKK